MPSIHQLIDRSIDRPPKTGQPPPKAAAPTKSPLWPPNNDNDDDGPHHRRAPCADLGDRSKPPPLPKSSSSAAAPLPIERSPVWGSCVSVVCGSWVSPLVACACAQKRPQSKRNMGGQPAAVATFSATLAITLVRCDPTSPPPRPFCRVSASAAAMAGHQAVLGVEAGRGLLFFFGSIQRALLAIRIESSSSCLHHHPTTTTRALLCSPLRMYIA